MLAVERAWGVGIFDPALGGDPLLFQHMFWFYSHPAVYIMILPGMGVISEVHHLLQPQEHLRLQRGRVVEHGHRGGRASCSGPTTCSSPGISFYAALLFSFLTMLVAVPSAIKVFNWTATLYRGSITFQAPMLFSLGFMVLFTIGGLTGLYLATLGTDIHLHDTYFVVAHFHFVMVGGMVLGYFAALHYWWPKMTGRMYSDCWSRVAASIIIVGFFLTFMPQFILGYHGMPRRYPNYPAEFQILNVMSTAGASILGLGLPDAGGLPDAVAVLRARRRRPTRGARRGWSGRRPARRRSTTSTTRRSWCAGRTSTRSAWIRWAAGCPNLPVPAAPRARAARSARPDRLAP